MDNWKEVQEGRLLNLKDMRRISLSKDKPIVAFTFCDNDYHEVHYTSQDEARSMYESIKTMLFYSCMYPTKY